MWDDDDHEKKMARNHLIAIILLLVALFGYMQWEARHAPPPQQQTQTAQAPQPAEPAATETPEPAGLAPAPAGMPATPETVDPATDEVTIQDADLRLVMTRIGARVKQAHILLGQKGEDTVQIVPPAPEKTPDTKAVYPLGLEFADKTLDSRLDHVRWDVEAKDERSVTFRVDVPGYATVRKTVRLDEKPHVIDVQVAYQNTSGQPQSYGVERDPAYFLYWGPSIETGETSYMMPKSLVWRFNGENETMVTGKAQERTVPGAEWIAEKTAYFAVAMKPETRDGQAVDLQKPDTQEELSWQARVAGDPNHLRFGVAAPSFTVQPNQTASAGFRLYVGPNHLEQLKVAWPSLPSMQRFYGNDIMNWFSVFLLDVLKWFYRFIPNYGVGIILLTILVRVAVFPLTIKQIKSMKRMQMLAPELEEIKKKYGEDQQELNKRMMELYRERGVSPLGGCLPLLVQMPVFFALYRMLSTAYELRGADFMLWINDLSRPDRLLAMPWKSENPLPYFGHSLDYLNLLPLLMMLAMILSMKFTPTSPAMQNSQQKMIMTVMPVMFSVFCYNLASGLCLYILTSTLLGIGQQVISQRINVSAEPPQKKQGAPRKRRHWYAAAQEKKRRQLKETRQGSKR